jgi:hypothetical protein
MDLVEGVLKRCNKKDAKPGKLWCIYKHSSKNGSKIMNPQPKGWPKHYPTKPEGEKALKMMHVFGTNEDKQSKREVHILGEGKNPDDITLLLKNLKYRCVASEYNIRKFKSMLAAQKGSGFKAWNWLEKRVQEKYFIDKDGKETLVPKKKATTGNNFDKILAEAYDRLRRDIVTADIIIKAAGDSVMNDTYRTLDSLLMKIKNFKIKLEKLRTQFIPVPSSGTITSISAKRPLKKARKRKRDTRGKQTLKEGIKKAVKISKLPLAKRINYADQNFGIMEEYHNYVSELEEVEKRLETLPKKLVRGLLPKISSVKNEVTKVFQDARKTLSGIAKSSLPRVLSNMGGYLARQIEKKAIQKGIEVKTERAILRIPDGRVLCVYYVVIENAKTFEKEPIDVFIALWATALIKDLNFKDVFMHVGTEYTLPPLLKSALKLRAKDRAKAMKFVERDLSRLGVPVLKRGAIKIDDNEYRDMGFIPENISVNGNVITVIESVDSCVANPRDPNKNWKIKQSYLINLYVATMKAAGIEAGKNPLKSVGRLLFRKPIVDKSKREIKFKVEVLPIGRTKGEVREDYLKRAGFSKKDIQFSDEVNKRVALRMGK